MKEQSGNTPPVIGISVLPQSIRQIDDSRRPHNAGNDDIGAPDVPGVINSGAIFSQPVPSFHLNHEMGQTQ